MIVFIGVKMHAKPIPPFKKWIAPMLFVLALGYVTLTYQPAATSTAFHGSTMGTTWSVVIVDPTDISTQKEIQDQLDEVNRLMSTYLPDSEISRFNRHDTSPFPISPLTETVIQSSIDIHKMSGAAFDITVGPIVNAWGFGFPPPINPPTEINPTEFQEFVGMQYFILSDHQIQKSHPDVRIDLSAIAKGFAVDQVVSHLESLGFENFLVEVGGELASRGQKWDRDWLVAIEEPQKERGQYTSIIPLTNQAMATSGDYRNYKEIDGVRVSHTIDPRSWSPITHSLASISVIAPTAMQADGWATALNVLGEEDALKIAEEYNLPIYMLIRENDGTFRARSNSAFESIQNSYSVLESQ